MARLADRFTLLAPDLRGFGDSDKPIGPFGPEQHAADMLALLDALGLRQVGLVGHDVGGALMQPLARKTPERFCGLFFFDIPASGREWRSPSGSTISGTSPSTSWRWRRAWSARAAKAAGPISVTS
jgi:pimeloyl-ACP methyl ester carboxylesterase